MALPIEILLGIYLGILTGIFPALVAWGLGFLFKYVTGVTLPGLGVVVLALAIAGINGGLLALVDPTVLESGVRVVVALLVVLMLALYAHAKGDQMGATFPRRISIAKLRERTLSSDVVEFVGSRGEVKIDVVGDVADMEGYPPLAEAIREEIKTGEWRLPADLPLSELETRFADRLKSELDLADVSVSIDDRGRASVVAAPPLSGLSKRVPAGRRAVSIDALVPTGMARGDEVVVLSEDFAVQGTVVSAKSGTEPKEDSKPATDGGMPSPEEPAPPARTQTTTGGEGRVTVAVTRSDAGKLLGVDRGKVVVRARGIRREFELVSLLRRAGKRFKKLTVRADGPLDGRTLGDADVRDTYDVAVLAVKRPDGWIVAPRGGTVIEEGDELFAVGRREALDDFRGAVA